MHCSLVKETDIPKVSNKEVDEVMDNLMTLAQNTAVSLGLQKYGSHKSLLDYAISVEIMMSVVILHYQDVIP